jgi:hypothetical protein
LPPQSGLAYFFLDADIPATQEQALGIDTVNKAVSEMDKVVQQNAANAEKTASASEEMSAQALKMKEFVSDLQSLVGGSKGKSTYGSVESVRGGTAAIKATKVSLSTNVVSESKANGDSQSGNCKDRGDFKKTGTP